MSAPTTMAEEMHNAASVMLACADGYEQRGRVQHLSIVLRDYARLMEGAARRIEDQRVQLAELRAEVGHLTAEISLLR